MSKGETKDLEAPRKRRGGLRVPSDEVPRKNEQVAAIPTESTSVSAQPVSVPPAHDTPPMPVSADRAMVSDRPESDGEDVDFSVEEGSFEDEPEVVALRAADITKPVAASPRARTSPGIMDPNLRAPIARRAETQKIEAVQEHEPEHEPAEHESAEHEPVEHEPAEHEPAEHEPEETGESVDIPFDDNEEPTISDPTVSDLVVDEREASPVQTIPTENTTITPAPVEDKAAPSADSPHNDDKPVVGMTRAATAKPAAVISKPTITTPVAGAEAVVAVPVAAAEAVVAAPVLVTTPIATSSAPATEADVAAPVVTKPVTTTPEATAAPKKVRAESQPPAVKKKPRFTKALTMALNESDLEEVRAGGPLSTKLNAGEKTAPVESADVIEEGKLETASKPPVTPQATPQARPKKKRADTAEPPPPPPAHKPVAVKPVTKPAAPDDSKRRQKKPWFEELFDEDYLRTLPFLTPKATQFEANFVMESLGVEAGAQILDVGCGYGRHAMELAARGYHLVGIDSSLPLLLRGSEEAQRRGLTINFVHGDMREMTFESQFDGAYCLFSSFGYFDDETNKRTAQNIAKALKPGARLVVEVLNRDYLVADLPSRVWWEGDGCVVLEEVEFNYFSSRIVSNRSVVFDDGRQLEHEISLRSFSLHELGKFLHAVGFRVLEISGSMSTRGRFFGAHSRDIVVVAERRSTKVEES